MIHAKTKRQSRRDWHIVYREGQSNSPWILLGEPTLLRRVLEFQ